MVEVMIEELSTNEEEAGIVATEEEAESVAVDEEFAKTEVEAAES